MSKENISPNTILTSKTPYPDDNQRFSLPKHSLPPSAAAKYTPINQVAHLNSSKERPNSARGPLFEFNPNTQTSERPKSKKRKPSSKPRKFKVNNNNEIHIQQNTSYMPNVSHNLQPDYDESSSNYSDHTAIPLCPPPVPQNEEISVLQQNKELKRMVASLSQTVQMLTSEFHKNMEAVTLMCNQLAAKNTLLESRVKFLEKRVNGQ